METRKLSELYTVKMDKELKEAKELHTKMQCDLNLLNVDMNLIKDGGCWHNNKIMEEIHRLAWNLANDASRLQSVRSCALQYESYKNEALQDEVEAAAGIK